jgi:hypothetical protein
MAELLNKILSKETVPFTQISDRPSAPASDNT